LNHTLVSKSESYTELGLRSIFRLNNSQYVLSALQRSGLIELVKLSEPDFENIYHEKICDYKTAYANRFDDEFISLHSYNNFNLFAVGLGC